MFPVENKRASINTSIYQHNLMGSGISRHSQNKPDFMEQPRVPHLEVLSLRKAFFCTYLPQNKQEQTFKSLTRQPSNIVNYITLPTKLCEASEPSSISCPPKSLLNHSFSSTQHHFSRLTPLNLAHYSVYLFQDWSGAFFASSSFYSPFIIFYTVILYLVLMPFQ